MAGPLQFLSIAAADILAADPLKLNSPNPLDPKAWKSARRLGLGTQYRGAWDIHLPADLSIHESRPSRADWTELSGLRSRRGFSEPAIQAPQNQNTIRLSIAEEFEELGVEGIGGGFAALASQWKPSRVDQWYCFESYEPVDIKAIVHPALVRRRLQIYGTEEAPGGTYRPKT